MAILFLDFTDNYGVGRNAARDLQRRPGNPKLIHLHLEKEAMQYRDTRPKMLPVLKLDRLAENEKIDEIIIGAHGDLEDIEYCFEEHKIGEPSSDSDEKKRLLSAKELAEFCNHVFQIIGLSKNQTLAITLAVCYAARTKNYRIDHIVNASTIDFRETFAYKFAYCFGRISPTATEPKARISAYLGRVSFNSPNGALMADTEEKTFGMLQADDITNKMDAIFMQLSTYVSLNASLQSSLEAEFDRLETKKNELLSLPSRMEYGKVVYITSLGGVECDLSRLKRDFDEDDEIGAIDSCVAFSSNEPEQYTPKRTPKRGR